MGLLSGPIAFQLFAGGPERPAGEDQHIEPVGPQIAFLIDELGVDVLDEDFPLEQVMVADRFGIAEQLAPEIHRAVGNQWRLDFLGGKRGQSCQRELVPMLTTGNPSTGQDLIEQPLKHFEVTEKGKFESRIQASAYWQMRINDLPGCLARTRLPWADLRLNLKLTDPIQALLQDAPWRGVAGHYVVTLGRRSRADAGHDASLPTLAASAGAFTRLWLGVRPATGLAATDDLAGPPDLLEALDSAFRLPDPKPDWDY